MSDLPTVTVVVPARDEEGDIAACLASIAAQDYPHDRMEVVVVDGASRDATAVRAKEALDGAGFARAEVLDNPDGGTTPSNLNAGLAAATGEILCRVDARSRIPSGYLRTCVDVLTTRPEVVVVGGAQVALAPRPDPVGAGIARALNNRWGMGFARYRRRAASGPGDTVYLGAFRTAELRAAGGWDVALPTNQDFDLNRRLGRHGVVWFEAGIDVGYVPRASLDRLLRQYHRFGRAKVRYWRHTGDRPRPRQVALLAAAPTGALALALAVRSGRRGPAAAALVLAGLAVEGLGTAGPRAGVRGRGASLAALAAVAIGWTSGAWRELVAGRRG